MANPITDPLNLVGTTVADKYDIERVVGEGGFAIVYRAMHRVWKRPVALKVFRIFQDLPPDRRAELVQGFIQEGALLAELSERSAAICQARDVGMLPMPDDKELPYMVLEWLEGRSLEQVIEDEVAQRFPPRTPEQAVAILEPAAHALALAHRKGIAHRDVKPANVFVLGDPRGDFTVKLLDFGIAKVVQDIQKASGAFQQTQGVVSSFTPAYGAPEQFSRTYGATGPWTDVFALALILTELLTHAPPLRGDDLTQLAYASMDPARRPTPRTYGAMVSDALEAVLRKALSVTPDDRYPSATEFWDAVRAAHGLAPIRNPDSSRSQPEPLLLASMQPSTGRARTELQSSPAPGSGQTQSAMTEPGVAVPAVTGPAYPQGYPQMRRTAESFTGPLGQGVAPMTLAPQPKKSGAGAAALVAGLVVVVGGLGGGVAWYLSTHPSKPAVAPVASASASPIASLAAAPAEKACPADMIRIPGGKFFMGSDDKKDAPEERPAHQVILAPYCIDRHEVTVARYKKCSDPGECKRGPEDNEWEGITAHDHEVYDPLCNIRDPEGRAQHPINCVDWTLADAFCHTIKGGHLPTEAEWEFATRGSDGRKYPWGDAEPKTGGRLNACGTECVAWGKKKGEEMTPMYGVDDGWPTTAPVGSFPKGASIFGLEDVVGNVGEWASDWYAPYEAGAVTDPQGPAKGEERVMRGGAWNASDVGWVRPTFRFKASPGLRSHGIGFRCAVSIGP